MIEILTSDPVIFVFTGVGLVATALSIVRDARAQHERAAAEALVQELVEVQRAA